MFPDFINQTIEDSAEPCNNCMKHFYKPYANRGFICAGILKKSKRKPKCDSIKFCLGDYECGFRMTPDESLILSSLLSHVNSEWLLLSSEYNKFRRIL